MTHLDLSQSQERRVVLDGLANQLGGLRLHHGKSDEPYEIPCETASMLLVGCQTTTSKAVTRNPASAYAEECEAFTSFARMTKMITTLRQPHLSLCPNDGALLVLLRLVHLHDAWMFGGYKGIRLMMQVRSLSDNMRFSRQDFCT